jgi:hypothetical protein
MGRRRRNKKKSYLSLGNEFIFIQKSGREREKNKI